MKIFYENRNEVILLTILPLFFLYRMVFFGEIVTTNDELERHPINEWRDNYIEQYDDVPQWYPNLFSGMPSYGGYIYTNGDPTKFIRSNILFNPGLKIWFYLSLSGIGMFVLLQLFKIGRTSALFGSVISAITPYAFGLINAGHLNKIFAMAYIPWVIAAALYFINSPTLKALLMLSLATALQLWANHPQVAYYTWMVIGFYYVWILLSSILSKTYSTKRSLYPLFGIIIGIAIALFMVSDPYVDIYKFQEHSNRGAISVLDQSGQTEAGTKWKYATQWSFHPKEMLSFIYPYHFGLQNTSNLERGAYWGYMPFTQSTHYVGLVVLIFAILGVLLKKPDRSELIFLVITILILITGFGSFFSILYKPFFSLLPFFSKFRIPSMIYMLLAITIPFLGAKGLDRFMKGYKDGVVIKKISYVLGGLTAVTLLLFMFGDLVFSFSGSGDARYDPITISKLQSARIELFNKGLMLAISICIGLAGLVYALTQKKINATIFNYALIAIAIFDIWIVNSEFMNIKPPFKMDRNFRNNTLVDYIIKDNGHFRIFPADEMGSNRYSYWNIESIGGYRPIKLRNYQDLMDARGFSRPKVLDMLNVKYVVTNKRINNPNYKKIKEVNGLYENKNVLPKSWIVGQIKDVNSQRESLMETLLSGFDPRNKAIVYGYRGSDMPEDVKGVVTIKTRSENRIELLSTSDTGGLLVLSEIYYEPGWRATVNGKETPIYQTNHVLRSVEIPKGTTEVIFEYDKTNWQRTRLLSRFSLITVILILGALFWKEQNKRID
ncbi:MAG: YfhO family protein [Candidatus Marinimicrobia bacterium]|nr:YfhO family protein [Candidatus Neomarinimicrobiota bacterium]